MFKKILAFTFYFSTLLFFTNTGSIVKADSMESTELENIIATFDLTNPEKQEQIITLPSNETAVVGLEMISNPTARATLGSATRAVNGTYKAYWYSGVANASFRFTVNNNTITSVFDPWYLFVGVSVKSANLTLESPKQATYYFDFGTPIWDFGGWNGWLRAKIDSNNKINYSIK